MPAGRNFLKSTVAKKIFTIFRFLRVHQWIKNTAVFIPLLGIRDISAAALLPFFLAFAVFSLASSIVYVLNDVCDLESDRASDTRRWRPLAAGELSIKTAWVMMLGMGGGLGGLLAVAHDPLPLLIYLYFLLNAFYSLVAKKILFLDVLLLASFFLLRMEAGAGAQGLALSREALAMALAFFLSLAALKRNAEISQHPAGVPGRPYGQSHYTTISALGAGCGLLFLLLLCGHLGRGDLGLIYRAPSRLFYVVPVFLAEASWIAWLARSRSIREDLTLFFLGDLFSWGALVFCLAILIWAR